MFILINQYSFKMSDQDAVEGIPNKLLISLIVVSCGLPVIINSLLADSVSRIELGPDDEGGQVMKDWVTNMFIVHAIFQFLSLVTLVCWIYIKKTWLILLLPLYSTFVVTFKFQGFYIED